LPANSWASLRRRSTAAAARPNSAIIGGAGTSVPLVEPDVLELVELELLVLEELEVLELDEVELEVEELVLEVMFPEVEVLVETSPEVEVEVLDETSPELLLETSPDELEVVVLLRKRTALSYLVEPLTRNLWRSGSQQ